jgi:hypothetical protein
VIAATLVVKIAAETAEFHRAIADSQRAVRGSAAQMEQASQAVTVLQTRMTTLSQAYRVGRLSEEQYGAQLRTLQADIRELAATTDLTAASQRRLAGLGGQVQSQLRGLSMQARRGAEGLEAAALAGTALIGAFSGGGPALVAAANQLQGVAVAARAVGAVTVIGAIAAIIGMVVSLSNALKNNKRAAEEALSAMRDYSVGRLRGILQTTQALAATARQGAVSGVMGPELFGEIMRAADIGRLRQASGTQRELLELAAARLTAQESQIRGLIQGAEHRVQRERAVTQEYNAQKTVLEDLEQKLNRIVGKPLIAAGGLPQPTALLNPQAGLAEYIEQRKRIAETAASAGQLALGTVGIAGPAGGPTFAQQVKAALAPAIAEAKLAGAQMIDLAGPIAAGIMAIAQSAASGFKNLGATLLGILGGLLQQMGQALVSFGVGALALKNLFKNPIAAIAAGAAMIALGAALGGAAQRSAAGSGSLAGPGSVAGASSAPTYSSGPRNSAPAATHSGPQTLVIQNIIEGVGGRELTRTISLDMARSEALGGGVSGISRPIRQRIDGAVVARRS